MFQTFGFEPLSKIKLGDICYDVSVWSEENIIKRVFSRNDFEFAQLILEISLHFQPPYLNYCNETKRLICPK